MKEELQLYLKKAFLLFPLEAQYLSEYYSLQSRKIKNINHNEQIKAVVMLKTCTVKITGFIFIHSFIHSFLQFVVCLVIGPYTLPKRVFHRVRSSASSCKFQYTLVSLRSSSSCLRLLLCLSVTFILPSVFLSTT